MKKFFFLSLFFMGALSIFTALTAMGLLVLYVYSPYEYMGSILEAIWSPGGVAVVAVGLLLLLIAPVRKAGAKTLRDLNL